MNWRRGLFRLWLMAAALWSLFVIYLIGSDLAGRNFVARTWAEGAFFLAIPWVLTAFGFGVRWVVAGFRPK